MTEAEETLIQRTSLLEELHGMGTPEAVINLIALWDDAILAQFAFFIACMAEKHRAECAQTCLTFALSKQSHGA